VTRFNDFDLVTAYEMTVPSDDETFERTGPQGLERACHCRRGFSGADQHRAAADRCRNSLFDCLTGVGRSKCSVEQSPQGLSGRDAIAVCHFAVPSCQVRRHFISSAAENASALSSSTDRGFMGNGLCGGDFV
jgi:hypothetical protein